MQPSRVTAICGYTRAHWVVEHLASLSVSGWERNPCQPVIHYGVTLITWHCAGDPFKEPPP
jgi:hypothetical protein